MARKKSSWLGQIVVSALIVVALQFAFAHAPTFADEGAPNVEPPAEVIVTEPVVVEPVVEPEITVPTEETVTEPVVAPVASEDPTPAPETATQENSADSAVAVEPAATPVLSTGQDDYHPGDTANIFGKFFGEMQSYALKVFGSDEKNQNYTEETQQVTADQSGDFSANYTLDDLYRPFYEVAAYDSSGNKVAETWFRDAAIGTYDQCSNDDGDGYALGDTGCRWINGNLQASNSVYFEHDATVQRLWLEGFEPGTDHTVTFKYGTTKGGKHAYDFLTEWSHSEDYITPADRCQDITGCTTASEDTLPIPHDPNTAGHETAGRVFTLRGGDLTSATTPTIVSGSYAGDSETSITVSFTVGPNNGDMCSTKKLQGQDVTSCGVALWFGAHVSSQADWGLGNSAVNITGSPYHVSLDAIDGASAGQRDNQMQSATILPSASITIIKDTVPDDAQDFSFTTTGAGLSNFSLDDDANGALSNTRTFNALAAGTYTVAEGSLAGFDLTNLVCVDPTSNSSVNLGTRTATINLAGGENVTCTFTNTKRGTIIVEKQTSPDGAAGNFTFTGTAAGTIADNGQITVNNLVPGTYTSTENNPAPLFALTNITCDDSNSTGNTSTRTATFNLQAGETVKCTFTNTLQTGHIVVDKVTVPSGDTQSFAFTTTGTGYSGFSLTDVAAANDQTLNAGAYSVAETALPGWTQTSATCVSSIQDTETPGALELDAGETITCTFTNTKKGHIIVDKVTAPSGDPQSFSFTAGGSGYNNFSLTDVAAPNNQEVVPGKYSVSEGAVANWNSNGGLCDQGETPGDLDVGPGETVTCTFTNTKNATIIVDKLTNPSGDPQSFGFTTTGTGYNGFSLTDVAAPNSQSVVPGTYSVNESALAGWVLVDARCNLNNQGAQPYTPGSNITLAAGDTVQCFFNNRKESHIIVDKVTVPAGDSQSFSFTTTGSGYAGFSLTDIAAPNNQNLLPGTYSVAETLPSGWLQTSATCVSSNNDNETIGTLSLQAGETITCTFTNTKKGHIIVDKVTNPSGDPQSFSFTAGGAGYNNFALTDIAAPNNQELAPGAYSVSETVPGGWAQGTVGCVSSISDNETPTSLELDPGETITCTFNNIKNATIIVKKVMVGGTDTFNFAGSPSGAISTNNGTIQASVAPGQHVSTETVATGWDLTSVTCDDQNSAGSVPNHNATFNAEAGETVTCTFTNTKRATIIVDKHTTPAGDSQSFTFTTNGTGYNGFSLTDLAAPNSQSVVPGTYSVNETPVAGWSLVGARCVLNSDPAQPYTPGANIVLAAGDTVTCFFDNVKLGKIIVAKQTDPDGDPQVFDFDLSYGSGDADLSDGQTADSGFTLMPGTYSVSETAIAGWDLESATCSDGSSPASINLAAGETVTCTFTNEKDALIIVDKVTNPAGDLTEFNFTASYDNDGFALADASTPNNSGDLDPGTYSVAETAAAGWDLTSAVCSDQSNPASISLQGGETVTCTFTNTKRGHIIVDKVTNPAGDAQSFSFDAAGGSYTDFALTDAAAPNNQELVPGNYSVSETVPVGWDQTSAVCDGQGNTPASITLGAGQTVTCTFTNTKRSKITVVKDADPNDCQDFAFTMTGQAGFSLDDNNGVVDCVDTDQPQSKVFSNIVPGNVTVTENLPNQFWKLDTASCVITNTQTAYASSLNGTALTVNLTPGSDVTCTFQNDKLSPTRTLGFWQTHTQYTSSVFAAAPLSSNMPIGSAPHKGSITTSGQLFGAFFSNIAKQSNGKTQRSAMDKARMVLLQQLVAAKLNCAAFGCASNVQTMIAAADAAYASGNIAAMSAATAALDAYNNSGDTLIIGNAGKATPQTSKTIADLVFWDLP